MKSFNEEEALRLLAQGSELAFRQLYDKYSPEVYRKALYLVKSHELAKEIHQDIFLKIWERRADLVAVQNFHHYILTWTRNYVLNQLREITRDWSDKQKYAKLADVFEDPKTFTTELEDAEKKRYNKVLQKAEELPGQCRKIFFLSKVELLTYEQIATLLGLSTLTVRNQMAKALSFLRKSLMINSPITIIFLITLRLSHAFFTEHPV